MSPNTLGAGDCRDTGPESEQLHGRYANYFEAAHNAVEFVLDFGQLYPDSARARLHTRIVTSPAHAQDLLRLLQRSIGQYREAFGSVPLTAESSNSEEVP